jgi:hypothetical protein
MENQKLLDRNQLDGTIHWSVNKKKLWLASKRKKHEVETNNRDSGDAWRRVK